MTPMMAQKVAVFLAPMTLPMTSMLGRARQKKCQGWTLAHPRSQQSLQDGDLGQGREIHERPGNEKSGDQTGQNMFPRVFLQHLERLEARLPDNGVIPGNIVGGQKGAQNQRQFFSFTIQPLFAFHRNRADPAGANHSIYNSAYGDI